VQVGKDARKDKKGARNGKNPSDNASTAPEEQAYAKQHRQQSNAEGILTIEIPIRSHHGNLIDQEVSSNAGHEKAQYEMTEPAGCAARVAERPVFHGRKYSRGGCRPAFSDPGLDDSAIAECNGKEVLGTARPGDAYLHCTMRAGWDTMAAIAGTKAARRLE